MSEIPVSSSIQRQRRKEKIPIKYSRKEPAIIPFEALIPQAYPITEPIISSSEVTESTSKETLLKTAFEKEIAELFDIPKEQIPTSQKSIDIALNLDLSELSLTASEATTQEAFSFLDYPRPEQYLMNFSKILQKRRHLALK